MKSRLYFMLMSFIGILTILAGVLEPTPPLTAKAGQSFVWTAEKVTFIPEIEFIITNDHEYDYQ